MYSSDDRSAVAFLLATSHTRRTDEPRPSEKHAPHSTLAIALGEQAGAGAEEVARELGRLSGWPVYDHELIEQLAAQLHIPANVLDDFDERHVSWLEENLEAFTSVPHVSELAFVRHLTALLLSLRARSDSIIVRRAAAQILPAGTTLRVRLVAPLAERAARLAVRLGLSQEVAAQRATALDRQHELFARRHFHCDPNDVERWDMMFNTSRCSPAECAPLILQAAHQRKVALSHAEV
jgi:cytidylate kinase